MSIVGDGVRWKNVSLTFLIILLFTCASVCSINQYRYGVSDQTITIPYVKSFLDSSLYPGDYVLGQKIYYYTYFWDFCGWVIGLSGISIPLFFFLCYAACIFFSFFAVYLIAKTLFQNRAVAFLSLFFLLFSHKTFAGSATIENLLLTKAAALPWLLFTIYFTLRGRYVVSGILLGVGFLIHPMSAVYVAAMVFIVCLVNIKQTGLRKFVISIAVFLLVASPVLIWKTIHTPASQSFLHTDTQWMELLRLRSSHHIFPFSWRINLFVQAVLIAGVFIVSLKHKPKQEHHQVVVRFVWTIVFLCIAGAVFTEIFPIAIVINLQLLRSFTFFWYIAMIYFANYFLTEMQVRRNLFRKLLVTLLSVFVFYGAAGWKYAFAAFLFLSLAMMGYELLTKNEFAFAKHFTLSLVVVVVLLGTGGYLRKNYFSIEVTAPADWVEAQRWVKQNTNTEDFFIVAPQTDGFRIESERTIYGDWKDGTLMNFNPGFGKEWFRRMENLGYEKENTPRHEFRQLNEKDILKIVAEHGIQPADTNRKFFFVNFAIAKPLSFPVVYSNKDYVIYEVTHIKS